MKTHSRLLAIIIAFAVIFSSIAFNSISFAEENPSEDEVVILEDSYEEEGLSEGEEEGLPEEEIVEEALPEGEGDEEGKEELDLPQEEAKEEDLPKEEVVEEDLPKEDIIQEPMNIQSESMEVNIQTIDEYGRKYEDIEGNDKLKFKVDPPVSKTIYFDKDGKEISDSDSIYWVKFTVSGDKKYLSFEANNLVLELLSVKGGDNYRLCESLTTYISFRSGSFIRRLIAMLSLFL